MVDDGMVENVKVRPLLYVMKLDTAVEAVALKSVERPVVAPSAPETWMVQVTILPRRNGFASVHERVEAVVGLP